MLGVRKVTSSMVEGIAVVALTTMKWMPSSTSQEDKIDFLFKILQPALPLLLDPIRSTPLCPCIDHT